MPTSPFGGISPPRFVPIPAGWKISNITGAQGLYMDALSANPDGIMARARARIQAARANIGSGQPIKTMAYLVGPPWRPLRVMQHLAVPTGSPVTIPGIVGQSNATSQKLYQ